MFGGIKRPFTNPQGQANALKVNGDINAPVNLINLTLENGTQITVPLDIKWSATKLQADAAPSQLLHWRRRLTDLLGRDDELAALKAWAQGGAESSQAQVIVGDGGVGKTRLAMELADWLRVNQHWRAGALSLSAASSFRALGAIAGNTLIVVDYPDANPDAVKRLLRAVVESEANKSIKLLFLTREHESMGAVIRDAGAQDLFAPTPLMLTPFEGAAYALFCAAFNAVATQSNAVPPNRATFATWQSCSPLHAAALFLVAAGVSVARYPDVGGASDAIPIGVKLLERMCEDETRKLQDIARGFNANPEAAVDVLAIATLLGDINFDALVALSEASACGIDDAPALRKALLASRHATQNNATSVLNITRLEPDLFAAAFMHRWHIDRWQQGATTQTRLSGLAAQCFATSEPGVRVASLNQWNRLAFDSAVRLEQVPSRLDGWLCQLLQDHTVLNRSLTHTWSVSVMWVGLPKAAAASREAIRDTSDDAERASILNARAVALANVGNHEDALAASCEAVELYRKLAEANPADYAPLLAAALNNRANRRGKTGDDDGAVADIREAVDLYRKLEEVNPDAYLPNLATCLSNLAGFRGEIEGHGGGLALAREASRLRRKLAQSNSDAYVPGLASSLIVLANRLLESGDCSGALVATLEAIDLYRKLAAANPAVHTPNLALALHNLGAIQTLTGHFVSALASAREAIEHRRKLAAANPAAYTADLARSMIGLAVAFKKMGNSLDGAKAADEAVNLLMPFALNRPVAIGRLLEAAKVLQNDL